MAEADFNSFETSGVLCKFLGIFQELGFIFVKENHVSGP
jgi:hypothetical protein